MKILVDMNLSPRWVLFLQQAGFEALHWSQAGRADALDVELMAYAAGNGYLVLTHDLDFSAILAATQGDKPSVIQIRAENSAPESVGIQLIAALQHTKTDLEAGALLTIDFSRTRIRLLPLKSKS